MKSPRIFAALAALLLAGGANTQVYADDDRDPYRSGQDRYDPYDRYSDSGYDNNRDGRGRVIRCESVDNRQRYCATGGAYARIVRQISRSPCVEGRTWASDHRGVWVDRGCRAEFELVHRDHAFRGRDNDRNDGRYDDGRYGRGLDGRGAYGYDQGYAGQSYSGGGRQVRCESRDFGRQFCRVPGLRAADIVHQISQTRCQFNGNWGYNRDGIWVDQGCAAEFVIR